MAPQVDLTVRNATGSRGSLETWGEALRQPKLALETIGALLERHLAERFRTRTDSYGRAWAPLSPTTIALHGDDGIDELATRAFLRVDVTKKRVSVGMRSSVARARQRGAPRNRMFGGSLAPIPPRGMLPLRDRRVVFPPQLHAQIMRALRDSLARQAKGGG